MNALSSTAMLVDVQIEELNRTDLSKRKSLWDALQRTRLEHRQAWDAYSAALVGVGEALDKAIARRDSATAALKQAELEFAQSPSVQT